MAATDTRFSLEGDIPGFLAARCVFHLTLHCDGSLTGTVSPSNILTDECTCNDTISLFDGVAVQSGAAEGSLLYNVKFQLAKHSDLPGLFFYIDVEGELSHAAGLQGRWNIAGSLGRAGAMDPDRPIHLAVCKKLDIIKQREDQVVAPESMLVMYPLTQGSYTLRGATIADNGYTYRATWTLTLRASGVLEGTSLENDNVPQLCRLEGSWTRTHVKLLMTYVVDGVVGTYTYEGDVRGGGLRGRCVSTKLPEATNECGRFEFNCVEAVRRWNIDDHGHYPKAFQDAVLACLLAPDGTRRAARLPSLLWREVFSFCGFEWFHGA